MSHIPEKIAGFEILQQLGEGGSGQVFKARQISLGRDVAVKILNPALVDSPEDIERFRHEAQTAARLKHPGIVQVYEFGEDQGTYFIAMEFVSGYSVSDWLQRKGPLAEANVNGVALGVARALEYAWDRQKLVHYDIKPDNVLIDEDGTVKVVDLGLASLLGTETTDTGNTTFHCTPNYASPEHIEGKVQSDFRTDMYSLGAMMYHLLTGQIPFSQHSETEVLRMHLSAELPDPHQVNPSLSIGMALLVRKLMAKNPAHRYGSWAEAIADIERVAKGEWPEQPLGEEHPSTVAFHRYEKKSIGRREIRVTHSPAAGGRPSMQAHPTALARPARSSSLGLIFLLLLGLGAVGAGVYAFQGNQAVRQRAALVQGDLEAAALFDEALLFAAKNINDHDKIAAHYLKTAEATKGTGYQLLAQTQVSLAQARKKRAVQQVLLNLSRQTQGLISTGRFRLAAKTWRAYTGPLEDATRAARELEATRLEQRASLEKEPES